MPHCLVDTGHVPQHWVVAQHSRDMQQETWWSEVAEIDESEAEEATDGGRIKGPTGRRAAQRRKRMQ